MATNDGGQAFPLGVSADNSGGLNHGRPGMTLRDYFAAHAPEVPDWFTVAAKPMPARPEPAAEWDGRLRNRALDWFRDPCYDLVDDTVSPEDAAGLRKFIKQCDAYWEACQAREKEQKTNRYFAWPWHYADAMLAERAK